MKKIFLAVIIFASAVNANAQTGFSLSLNAGIASPTGNFSKSDYSNDASGYSKTGFHINLDGLIHLNKNWGIGVLFSNSQFGHKDLINLSDGYKEDSGTDSTTLVSKGDNNIFSVLAGPVYTFSAGSKLSISLRALGGYSSVKLSGFTVFYEDYTDNALTQNNSTGGGFGFQAGAGISYKVAKNVYIDLNADYFTVKPKLDVTYQNFVVNSGRRLSTYNESISSVNTTLGIGFRF